MRPATLISRGKYNPTAQSSGSRNNDRANVLDKNAVSLATGAVFPQRSTATDGDLRRRPVWRERISISSGRLRCIFHEWPSFRLVLDQMAARFRDGDLLQGRCALYHKHRKIDVGRNAQKVFAYQKWISVKWFIEKLREAVSRERMCIPDAYRVLK